MQIGLVTGTVGVGKTTVGFATAKLASAAGASAAFLDLDALSRRWPAPVDDPFNEGLVLANLRSLVPNYRSAGAALLVLAVVIEDVDDLADIESVVGAPVMGVRLRCAQATVDERLRCRHQGPEADGLAWHLRRSPELVAAQELLDLPVVDAEGPVGVVAADVLSRFGR